MMATASMASFRLSGWNARSSSANTMVKLMMMEPEPLCDGCYMRCQGCAYFYDDEDFVDDDDELGDLLFLHHIPPFNVSRVMVMRSMWGYASRA